MALVTNAMAAANIQPKYDESGLVTIVCTQAIAVNATTGTPWKLFNVASDMTIVDMYLRLATACGTSTGKLNIGIATNAATFIETAGQDAVTVARATKGLPYTCTADTPIYCYVTTTNCTAASNLIVVATLESAQNIA